MVHSFSSENRSEYVQKLKENVLDVLVIGGGVTGAGIALDAAVRGLEIGLVDMQDFGSGSSSHLSSLFHNELRQAHQLDMKWHGECVRERVILQENAPHLMKQSPLMLPSYRISVLGRHSFGSKLVERISEMARGEKRKTMAKKELAQVAPFFTDKSIKGAAIYREFWRDETRLTIDLLKEAAKRGVTALNYAKVESFLYEEGQAKGVLIIDQLNGDVYKVYAKKIINASGVWIDSLREQDRSISKKSIHYTSDRFFALKKEKLPIEHILYMETKEKKLLSLIPRGHYVLIALTRTKLENEVTQDIDIALQTLNDMFTQANLSKEDIQVQWEVRRPFITDAGKNKREVIKLNDWFISESGLITVVCSQLTSYRLIAKQVVDWLCKSFQVSTACETDTLTLSGGYVGGMDHLINYKEKRITEGQQYGLTLDESERIVDRYGSNTGQIYARVWAYKKQAHLFGLPDQIFAELLYSIEEEMTATPVDFFERRTGYLYLNKELSLQMKEPVLRYMRDRFNWSEQEERKHRDHLEEKMAQAYRLDQVNLLEKRNSNV
ncbi:FAD-dependent oxidoreductase [Shouchella patagoniensis]|uniref:FAD-dependent oxidoreductase n=1 Tax=Shouchella patagoniensis TaxID=228576 RepID=UPI0009953C87|nr:FAD-dependent oxidoreductase [Shouchella patagoniensis]